jgi:muramoyltetrapeptide carboxypeptidase LdcA involved in peptidoglycan recycling
MTNPKKIENESDISTQIFKKFIQALEEAQVPTDQISRLRKTLLEDKNITDHILEAAIFGGALQT